MNPELYVPSIWHIKGPGERVLMVIVGLIRSPKVTLQNTLIEQLPYICFYITETLKCDFHVNRIIRT